MRKRNESDTSSNNEIRCQEHGQRRIEVSKMQADREKRVTRRENMRKEKVIRTTLKENSRFNEAGRQGKED